MLATRDLARTNKIYISWLHLLPEFWRALIKYISWLRLHIRDLARTNKIYLLATIATRDLTRVNKIYFLAALAT
mgnify:CR=1 FL=1